MLKAATGTVFLVNIFETTPVATAADKALLKLCLRLSFFYICLLSSSNFIPTIAPQLAMRQTFPLIILLQSKWRILIRQGTAPIFFYITHMNCVKPYRLALVL